MFFKLHDIHSTRKGLSDTDPFIHSTYRFYSHFMCPRQLKYFSYNLTLLRVMEGLWNLEAEFIAIHF
jgi:hypothetical protein